jgi:glycosyltransferase involved in cell wall biosynthesis
MAIPNHPKDNTLILITNHFPYGISESFLESELEYLVKSYRKVIVLARDINSPLVRPAHEGYTSYRVNPKSDIKEIILTSGLYLKYFKKVVRFLRAEIRWLHAQEKKITPAIVRNFMHTLTKALTTSYHLNKIIHAHSLTGAVTLYSYWLTSSALATTFITSKRMVFKRLARAHGGDVYENRNALHYLSFRSTLISELDAIFAISENGAQHLRQQMPSKNKTIRVSRLGTPYAGIAAEKKNQTPFVVVSCSFLVPVKRIHLIIEALSTVQQVSIRWIHLGDGPLKENLQTLAAEKLGARSNIQYSFQGAMTNAEVLAFYKRQPVDLFINTSSSEGIPVTMMEAQSFGIPVMGPDVGGVSEIISTACGRLFSPHASPQEIAGMICELLLLPADESAQLRAHSLQNWRERYNAEQNFSTFVTEILNL